LLLVIKTIYLELLGKEGEWWDNVMPCATHTSRIGWRAYKTFQPAARPVARHCCYLFGGLYGRVGWAWA